MTANAEPSAGPQAPSLDVLRSRPEVADLHRPLRYRAGKASYILGMEHLCGLPLTARKGKPTTILDLKGPGSLRHIWETNYGGPYELCIYVDGETTPSVHGTMDNLIAAALRCRQDALAVPASVVPKRSNNLYLPVYFQSSLRVDLVPLRDPHFLFMQLDYRTQETSVPKAKLVQTGEGGDLRLRYEGLPTDQPTRPTAVVDRQTFDLRGDGRVSLDGPGIVRRLEIPQARRGLRLRIRFDGTESPAVDVDSGDVFGPFEGALLDRKACYFPMPFAQSATIELDGAKPDEDLRIVVDLETPRRMPPSWRYFHARSTDTPATTGYDPHVVLNTTGRGHFVGVSLYDTGHDHGGGDFAVLDAATPQRSYLHGINGEDYFSFAWFGLGRNPPYTEAVGNREGRARFHIESPYPFEESLLLQWATLRGLHPRSVAYWYQSDPTDRTVSPETARGLDWQVFGPLPVYDLAANGLPDTTDMDRLLASLPTPGALDAGKSVKAVRRMHGRKKDPATGKLEVVEHTGTYTGWSRQRAVGAFLNLTYVYRHVMDLGSYSQQGCEHRLLMAATTLTSDRDRRAVLELTYDDPLVVDLGERQVHVDRRLGNDVRTAKIAVELSKGPNRLLVRMLDTIGDNMNFAFLGLRVLDENGRDITAELQQKSEQPAAPTAIVTDRHAGYCEQLAAREIRRYVYLRTGRLLPIAPADALPDASVILVANQGRSIARNLSPEKSELGEEAFRLKTIDRDGRKLLLVQGGAGAGTLFGAYRWAEHLGCRFYLHGDVIPDARVNLALPDLDETAEPNFAIRGILPWHDFFEGPDWWDLDHYKSVLTQLTKLRMNYIGLHTYTERRPVGEEPLVWVGLPNDIGDGPAVDFAYASSWQNTVRGNWGMAPRKTGEYLWGAATLFDRDEYGADVMRNLTPRPDSPEACNLMFERAGRMLNDAFRHGRRRGVRIGVGTEAPMVISKALRDRCAERGMNPKSIETVGTLYEGQFRRILQTYPIDSLTLWAPEHPEHIDWSDVQPDIDKALDVGRTLDVPWTFSVMSWGWFPSKFAELDKALPKDVALGCISWDTGKSPVDARFAAIASDRPTWAGPWIEDDAAMTTPQFHAGRMLRDVEDAWTFGCSGVVGVLWRTRVVAPTISAMARACWEQTGPRRSGAQTGPVGGKRVHHKGRKIAGTDNDPVYASLLYDLDGYTLQLPNGRYDVTLQFCEVAYRQAGKRVFGVGLQGKYLLGGFDIFQEVGANTACDRTFEGVEVVDGLLTIQFAPKVDYPCLSGIVVRGKNVMQKINVGGPAFGDYTPDPSNARRRRPRSLPSLAFYRDWAGHAFGPERADEIAKVFSTIDGDLRLRGSRWGPGPGQIATPDTPADEIRAQYAFVDDVAKIAGDIRGAGNRARFAYWLATVRYMRAQHVAGATFAAYRKEQQRVAAIEDPDARRKAAEDLLPLRRQLVAAVKDVYDCMFATISTPGELGTLANWEQHILGGILHRPGRQLEQWLGQPLPDGCKPATTYDARPRLIVPTVRTSAEPGRDLAIKVLCLSKRQPVAITLHYRPMGGGEWTPSPVAHVARSVYRATLPADAVAGEAIEYYLTAQADGEDLVWPATAGRLNQTVIVLPADGEQPEHDG